MLVLNKNILTIGGNRLEGGPLTPPTPPGPSFRTVTIGNQIWMADNMSIIPTEGEYDTYSGTSLGLNFGTQYYYNKTSALSAASTVPGWRLPTESDWDTLFTYCGGLSNAAKKLKSTSYWSNNGNGTDDYGFTALPCGPGNMYPPGYGGTAEYLCNSTTNNIMIMYYDSNGITKYNDNYSYVSVRLIKDT